VEAKIVDETGETVTNDDVAGELRIRGKNVFKEYWNREAATQKEFDRSGWFCTGDVASRNGEGRYRILGRASADMLKTGGYKVSALEIERELLEHPSVSEVAVLGLPDVDWGQLIAAMVVLRPGHVWDPDQVSLWARQRLASYKVPKRYMTVQDIPKNAMGKVAKNELVKYFVKQP
jgi:malonyl-CoA/methylmalonyl-CoA synthetase